MSGGSVTVPYPAGSPSELRDTAVYHRELASELASGAAAIRSQAATLQSSWDGASAQAFQNYVASVHVSFANAAASAEDAATILADWATKLEHSQNLSKQVKARAAAALSDVEQAESDLTAANSRLTRAQTAATAAAGPAGSSAAGYLATAQFEVKAAEQKLSHAQSLLQSLNSQGIQINETAVSDARSAGTSLAQISFVAPPLPAAPAAAPTVMPITAVSVAGAATVTSAGGSQISAGGGSGGSAVPDIKATQVPANLTPVSSGTTQGAISFGDLEEIGKQYGWSPQQDAAWWKVIQLESGGNPDATNPSSGAYGIGQFLGGTMTEYAPYGAASSNPMDQLNAMAKYIHDRYGSPASALSFHLANNWY